MTDASGLLDVPVVKTRPLDQRSRRASVDPADFSADYTFAKTLGEGSFGKVKLAIHNVTGEKFAVKIMKKKNMKKPKDVVRSEREIKVLTLISHPNIAKLYKVSTTEEHIYLVMEFAPGGELFDYIVARGKVKEPQARIFFREICSAVAYCHANHIIHRDLKPENLLLDAEGHIKIIDFGFANSFSDGELMQTFCGSPAYAAPEMLKAEAYVGPKVDIWAMGVILFALVAGYLPFDAPNINDLYKKAMKGQYQVPFFVSPECTGLLQRMLVVDPSKRADLHEVMTHRWVCEGFSGPPDILLPVRERPDELDSDIVRELVTMGFDEGEVTKAALDGAETIDGLAYHLMGEKRIREAAAEARKMRGTLIETKEMRRSQNKMTGFLPPLTEEGLGGKALASSIATGIAAITPMSPSTRSPGKGERTGSPASSREGSLDAGRSREPSPTRAALNATGPLAIPKPLPGGRREARRRYSAMPANSTEAAPVEVSFVAPPSTSPAPEPGSPMSAAEKERKRREENLASAAAFVMETDLNASGGARAARVEARPAIALDGSMALPPAGPAARAKEKEKRRFSVGAAKAAIVSKFTGKKDSPDKKESLRVVKGPFSIATTSTRTAQEMADEVEHACTAMNIQFERKGFLFECTTPPTEKSRIQFEVEICALERLALRGIKLKRVSGDTWAYKNFCIQFLALLKL